MKANEKKHARFSASSSERWLACPGSMELSKKAPPQVESKYAKEGTDAHHCVEYLLLNRARPVNKIVAELKQYPREMIEHAVKAAELILKMVPEGADLFAETKSDLSFIDPEAFGTADAVIVEPFGRLIVIDFKYGAGVQVDPENNSQLAFYALGVAHKYDYDFSSVEIVVIQPRVDHEDGPVRSWILSIPELMAWTETFREGIARCKDPLAPLVAGEHCRFCPAKTICPEISDKALVAARLDFAPLADSEMGFVTEPEIPAVTTVLDAEMPDVLNALPKLETWIDAVRERAFAMLERGAKIPGWKLVDKRGQRKWADPEKATAQFFKRYKEDIFVPSEILSPAQMEKAFPDSKELVEKLTTTISSGLTLVPDSDKRPAVNPAIKDFAAIEESPIPVKKVKTKKAVESEADWKKKAAKKKFIKQKFARRHRAGQVKASNMVTKKKKRK